MEIKRHHLRVTLAIIALAHVAQAQFWPLLAPPRYEPSISWGTLDAPMSWPMQPLVPSYQRPVPQSPTRQCRIIGACKPLEEGTTITPVVRTTTAASITTTQTPTTIKPTVSFSETRPSSTSPRPTSRIATSRQPATNDQSRRTLK